MKFSQEQTNDTIIPNIVSKKIEQTETDKNCLGYFPIEDNNSRFDLVEIKTTNIKVMLSPHCKLHGAMNCVAVHKNGKLWRCIQSNQLKDCRAGCEERYEQN